MKAIILVGGEGTRLRPLTINSLKSTVPMAGHPFLEYQFNLLKRHGFDEVTLSICHMPQIIKKTFGTGKRFGIKLNYAIEEQPLGTAGAIKNAEKFVRGKKPVAVLNGDILSNVDLSKMLSNHKKNNALASIALSWVNNPSAYGVVQFKRNGRVERFIEKPSANEQVSNWINGGIYIFDPSVFDYIPKGEHYSAERGLFPELLHTDKKVWAYQERGYWKDIGTLDKYHQANLDILEGQMFMLPVGKAWKQKKDIRVGVGCKIHPMASIFGPLVIGDRCSIEADVRLGESSILGKQIKVGQHVSIERSVIWDDVTIESGAKISGCVIGRGCKIGKFASLTPGSVIGDHAVVPPYSRL